MVARYTIVNSFLQIGRQVYRKRRILIKKHRTQIFSKMSKPPKYKMFTQKLETRFWRKLYKVGSFGSGANRNED